MLVEFRHRCRSQLSGVTTGGNDAAEIKAARICSVWVGGALKSFMGCWALSATAGGGRGIRQLHDGRMRATAAPRRCKPGAIPARQGDGKAKGCVSADVGTKG